MSAAFNTHVLFFVFFFFFLGGGGGGGKGVRGRGYGASVENLRDSGLNRILFRIENEMQKTK